MKLEYQFTRDEASFGTDAVPTNSAYLANDNVFHAPMYGALKPLRSVAVAYQGPAGAVDALAELYLYDQVSDAWYLFASDTIASGSIHYVPLPNIVDRQDSRGRRFIDVAVVLRPNGVAVAGTYTFSLASSTEGSNHDIVNALGSNTVEVRDSANLDAFGRLRVSNPTALFDSQQQFGDTPLLWSNDTSGAGSVSNQLDRASVLLSTGGNASGDYAYRQTKTHFRYQPGKSDLVVLTFVIGTVHTNARARIGAFDEVDGLFLEVSDDTYLCKRTSTSGSPVDIRVAQADWNIDKLDGSGPSGKVLDITTGQILLFDFQWLGMGRVRVGFNIDGVIVYVHEFNHSNILDVVYMGNANLPCRAEVENTGVATGTTVLEQICCSVVSEGGFEDEKGFSFGIDTGAALITGITTQVPVLSLRAAATGPNGVRNIGQILPELFEYLAQTGPARFEVFLNPSLNGASWTSVSAAHSIAEYDISAGSFTGGVKLLTMAVPAGGTGVNAVSGAGGVSILAKEPVVYDTLLGVGEIVTVAVTALDASTDVWVGVNWKEIR